MRISSFFILFLLGCFTLYLVNRVPVIMLLKVTEKTEAAAEAQRQRQPQKLLCSWIFIWVVDVFSAGGVKRWGFDRKKNEREKSKTKSHVRKNPFWGFKSMKLSANSARHPSYAKFNAKVKKNVCHRRLAFVTFIQMYIV